jgi:hypothetical protein
MTLIIQQAASAPLPEYRSLELARAAPIERITRTPDGEAYLVHVQVDDDQLALKVDDQFFRGAVPVAGDYLVVIEGVPQWAPRDLFQRKTARVDRAGERGTKAISQVLADIAAQLELDLGQDHPLHDEDDDCA